MSSELKKDLDEWKRIIQLCYRLTVKEKIQSQINELEKQYAAAVAEEKSKEVADTSSSEPKNPPQTKKVYCRKIDSYAWDQSDAFVKIYATNLPGVQSLPSENVNCHFSSIGFNLVVNDLDSKNHQLQIVSLYDKIVPEESRIKLDYDYMAKELSSLILQMFSQIKTDTVLVMLKKANKMKWEGITEIERRKKDNEALEKAKEKDEDPGSSIMKMMKKMYDEGDDEMKRSIAKAWTESQEKRAAGLEDI